MARTAAQDGDVLPIPAPYAVNAGQVVVVNNLIGPAACSAASAEDVEVITKGVHAFAKANAASTSAAVGTRMYWDNAGQRATISATSNTLLGICAKAAANTDTAVFVRLNGSF
jgi:predicted RecA/RadA family phage recombinase